MVKLNWTRGKSLGLAFIYFGVIGFFQILFMILAQYQMQIGSKPIIIIVPIGVIFATFYSVIILFESNTSMMEYRNKHKYQKKSSRKKGSKAFLEYISVLWKNPFIRPIFYFVIVFCLSFGLSYLICSTFIDEPSTLFVLADNFGAIGCLIFANYTESSTGRKTR